MLFKPEHGCFTILFDVAHFLLAVMVQGDESSRLPALIDSPGQE